jgi:hypothetical protein
VPARPRVGADHDLHRRPDLADATDDALELIDHAGRRIDVGRAQAGTQQVLAGEELQRQVTVVAAVAVE